ncbi:hypothetical protein A2697_00655 [Candidatus Curtissbacteria bacterium RIFCSPHIGHO2_01_FULL_41_44]|uniref:Triosephosphate isomerase n=1 Tax=Candidatus Curtissbacteria bacterium RIFCSPLOWO2_01_FULL_42_50 TaxID=1797730 RepID=A0A1F5H420_9BACT|nr:MAG: hypothetical protein A2697_00655 [Candidatus Curtissbacteria bacterium RIFCSPHIGHO2_01_FULL_41_44]OGD93378.1 MAG: hypothetical protein A3C33_03280 [Candidatus Curtissbacteria bacterium RIFCSPHIGHO2_02_FULL_42_58]OGD97094.1 MAG: hypothetical protein A3E71_04520 [Candidatus Curtissbacteria bacterium RIFCSPHIGHO2_12_FULL_42_33]OGD98883.1 MAG: hypothetical protein A3B54_04985 [Candidatus Curtissbacteria bacterium RIFCSPLOWO2_01_FULL_42_50]OGE03014.1 MAG: hypothetical protein A3G16_04800 [Ca
MNDPLPLVIANLKANKTWDQMSAWLNIIGPKAESFAGTVIVCPTAAFLAATFQKINSAGWQIKLSAQDISQFEQGAYTGEVAASQIADLCRYVIIGHSERRQNFNEDDNLLAQKAQNAKKAGLEIIFCIQNPEAKIPEGVNIVAYEPIFAIGTGHPDTPENAQTIGERLKAKGPYTVLYGGSVSPQNTKSFIKQGILDGVLIGANSLDPQKFIQIIKTAS